MTNLQSIPHSGDYIETMGTDLEKVAMAIYWGAYFQPSAMTSVRPNATTSSGFWTVANQQQTEAAARAIEPLIPYRDASNNGPIAEMSDGSFVHLTTWNIAVAALEAAGAN